MSRQRAVRQQLEDLRRAGVTHVPADVAKRLLASVAPAPSPAKPAASPAARSAPSAPAARPMPTAASSSSQRHATTTPAAPQQPAAPAARPTSAAASFTRPAVAPITVAATPALATAMTIRPGCSLSREERIAQLSGVAAHVTQCTRCSELARTRTQTVFGVGNPEASIMFIGEAPGADEDAQGEPFVGEAGKLLTKIIVASKLTREEVYICNVLRCRPPGNRVPSPVEASNCREYLDAQIATVNPQWIVCLGATAAQNLLNTKAAIGKLRGAFHDYKGIKVLCTYHPSYLLRYEPAKKDLWADIKMLRAAQGVTL